MGHQAMTAYLRQKVGGRALEKLRSGDAEFLRNSTFESHSLIGILKNRKLVRELRRVATSPEVHEDNRTLAWEAMKLMKEPPMR